MNNLPILRATPRFEKWLALSGSLVPTAVGLFMIVECFGFTVDAVVFAGFMLAFALVIWAPLALLVTYLNRPFVTLTQQGIAVQPEHQMVKARVVLFSKCHWSIVANHRMTLRLFPFYYSMTKVG